MISKPISAFEKKIKKFKIEDDYCLITDIEGNEAPIFFEDSKALGKCVNIIAEIEDTQNVSANRQINQLKKIGFSLIEHTWQSVCFQQSLNLLECKICIYIYEMIMR